MKQASLLPEFLTKGHHSWQASVFQSKKALFADLIENGQHPHSMVISCCDSRVHPAALFGGEEGQFFVHRTIANLVPPYRQDGDNHGTAAALQYAVTVLGVSHILVMGHSHCGGVKGCYAMCSSPDAASSEPSDSVSRWLEPMRTAYARLALANNSDDLHALEREAVLVSLENVKSHPFVQAAMAQNKLALHGLWHDIAHGALYGYDATKGDFTPV